MPDLADKIFRERNINKINEVFNKILKKNSFLMEFAGKNSHRPQDLPDYLKDYQKALIKEVQERSVCCTHPLRAVYALEILNDNGEKDFFLNLETFQKESSNSELYPTTVRIGAAIGIALMAAVSIALVTLVNIGLFNLITLSAFAAFLATPEIYSAFDDVYETKEKGKVIYGFFSDRKTKEQDNPLVESRKDLPRYKSALDV